MITFKKAPIIYLFSLFLFVSCFHDEGIYNYSEPLVIQVEGIEKQYKVSAGEVIKLHPNIYPDNRKYECFWTIAPSNAQTAEAVDTISRSKDFEYTVNKSIGAYKLRFRAKDIETGIFAYNEYLVDVTTEMASGWWVLKGEDKETDFDFFSSLNNKKKENILKTNGYSMKGEPLNLHFTHSFWHFDPNSQKDVLTSTVFVASTEDIVAIDYFTGQILSQYEDLFVDKPEQRNVRALFAGPSDVHVYVDNTVYTMYNSKYTIYKQFIIKTLGDYELSQHIHSTSISLPILFNQNESSFCSVSRNAPKLLSFTQGPISPNNMGMDLLFLGGKTNSAYSPGDEVFAIMKKRESEEYKLLKMEGLPYTGMQGPLIKESINLDKSLDVLHAEFKTLNQNNNIIYYSKNNKLYSCNLDTQTEDEQSIALPADEEITYMEFLKYSPYGSDDSWFDYLVIATAKGQNYKLYLHPVNAGEVKPADKTFEGKGRVKRVCYMEQTKNGYYRTTLF